MLSHINEFDHYWRLQDYLDTPNREIRNRLLKSGGIRTKSNACKAELTREILKLDLHRLVYGVCEDDELVKFIKDRQIKGYKKGAKKGSMIDLLEKADEKRTFNRFMDLPPELRERVAFYYMADFGANPYKMGADGHLRMPFPEDPLEGQVLEHPTQPPLMRASRHLRCELLPLFYKTCTFTVYFAYTYNLGNADKGRKFCRIHPESAAWLMSLMEENIKWVRNWRFKVCMYSQEKMPVNRGDPCFTYDLRIGGGEEGVQDVEWREREASLPKYQKVKDQIDEELRKVLEKIDAREGPKKFKFDDIYAVRRAIEASFGSPWDDKFLAS